MKKNSKIYIAGHTGLLGSAIIIELLRKGYNNLILRSHSELDLRNQNATREFFEKEQPEYIFLAAAKVGGGKANLEFCAEFIHDNLQIQNNVIHYSWKFGAKKLIFFGSNCMYPLNSPQPVKEESFLSGKLEKISESYAVAKISGVEMCQAYNRQYGANFISAVPASMFGKNDNFSYYGHFTASTIKKIHQAKLRNDEEVIFGSCENKRREIIYSGDVANASLFLMNHYNSSDLINIGFGKDYSLGEISRIAKEIIRFKGRIKFNSIPTSKVNQKFLDSNKINSLGWNPKTSIEEGMTKTYKWFTNKNFLNS